MKILVEDDDKQLRIYSEDPQDLSQQRVKGHYYRQHRLQTVGFVQEMVSPTPSTSYYSLLQHKKWLNFTHAKMSIMDCLDMLANFLDESDPDVDEANMIHAYQTAERIRAAHPDKPHMHLAGLVHDLGKIMSVWGEEQWAVTGTGDGHPIENISFQATRIPSAVRPRRTLFSG